MPARQRDPTASSSPKLMSLRSACEQEGEPSAAIGVRREFLSVTYNVKARECARTTAARKSPIVSRGLACHHPLQAA